MKKSTIVRTIMTLIVIVNMALKSFGKPLLDIDEASVYSAIEAIISIAIIVLGFWKNNSFTKNAQAADVYLQELKKLNESDGDIDG